MRLVSRRWLALLILVAVWSLSWLSLEAGRARAESAVQTAATDARWYKGNTHTHTLNSDGDSTPDEVVRWYREHGYQFLVLSDHNYLTSPDALNALHGASEKFLVVRGEEISDTFENKPLHLNGLDVRSLVPPQHGTSIVDVLQRNVDAIRKASGVPHINHPNFRWAITADDLKRVKNYKLLEIYNGHPETNVYGGNGIPSNEQIWDSILSDGSLVYGIAVDDAHTFKRLGDPNVAGPGRGWVAVRAARLESGALLEALERGDFYASTGVELTDYRVTSSSMTVTIRKAMHSGYRVQFIGKGGRVLQETSDSPATYTFKGDEGYVRAKVFESNGDVAWCQPVLAGRAF